MQNCTYCQQAFTNGQYVAKYRCGHAACTDCFDTAIHRGWHRCTICRRSGTTRPARAIIEPVPDEDLAVFIQPENGVAVAAAASGETITISSDDFIPRHVVVKNLTKHPQDKIEAFDSAIGDLITQLLTNCDPTGSLT
ncbi:MAG: hypothetical protein ACKPKO_54180, partial [Candidatus Fonsibacter sp.]